MMSYITLSHPLTNHSPVYPGLHPNQIIPQNKITTDGYTTYLITIENHNGTHLDAPAHFLENGKSISDYTPQELYFSKPLIWDCPKTDDELIMPPDLEKAPLKHKDCLFLRTGFEKYRESDTHHYLTHNPGLHPDTVHWIRNHYPRIRCVGMDCVSISPFQNPELGHAAHIKAFSKEVEGNPLLLAEDLKLGGLNPDKVVEILIVPWQILGVDSAPCTILAHLK